MIDLSGVVKALTPRDAGAVLDTAEGGAGDWMISAGGDVLVRGHHRGNDPWSVGVIDPAHRDTVVGSFGSMRPGGPHRHHGHARPRRHHP
ncbi:FAD:protein FMN transferase (plasmid) [Curtobacterium flaccumfaciens]|uniref:FAD:protein FMN transferase n=1 Tax=Curtobacterium TaxID=2034 RepID=UPI001BDFF384|nr:FAD:protein FMN transferase [Curtobacterium flaccumfaciens]MBT1620612.1 FAD:protein FMN transferase [Curtobacterium flaccumfaciens pv. poinsettiae]MCS6563656.1 FAD:protein FMN transferase [Curtobacterium flaccumfaciens pv. poinsettiae]UXN27196.1 FAD:protein FMN transferase [Curtobacterium flaccumfaciens]